MKKKKRFLTSHFQSIPSKTPTLDPFIFSPFSLCQGISRDHTGNSILPFVVFNYPSRRICKPPSVMFLVLKSQPCPGIAKAVACARGMVAPNLFLSTPSNQMLWHAPLPTIAICRFLQHASNTFAWLWRMRLILLQIRAVLLGAK